MSQTTIIFLSQAFAPITMLFFMAAGAAGITLVRRYAPPKLRAILLKKLW